MPLFHEPRCPRCAHELPMRTLWEFAKLEESYVILGFGLLTRGGYLSTPVGITCPGCRSDFRVTQTRILVGRTSLWLAWALSLFFTGYWTRQSGTSMQYAQICAFGLFSFAVLCALIPQVTPYLATVRPPRPDEVVSFPLKNAYRRSDNET